MRTHNKRVVYFNEYNVRMGRMCYLPLVSGLLRAHAEADDRITSNYRFKPFIFHLDSLANILGKYDEAVDVAAFSLSMWNEQLNLRVAQAVKQRNPGCLVVFGGPQVPHDPAAYMARHHFIDVCVRAEGEEAFTEILLRFLESRDFRDLAGVSFREAVSGDIVVSSAERPFVRDLNMYPSPYLEGLYDDLIASQGENLEFQAIIETNRGCPFQCTFCYWGRGGLSRKYRYHDMDRVFADLEWCARNKIRYVFNADSNFGMHKRDPEIAEFLVDLKKRHGFPDKFRTCYGKNTDEKIFQIGSLFHRHRLEKGITLARQSNDDTVLQNIKRANIKMSTYRNLQARFNDEDIPIYSELILGLPGETIETWTRGIGELLEAGLKNQLFIYLCQIFPNTDLGDPAYQKKFGVQSQRIELNEIHGSVRDASWVTEYEDIIIATDTMSVQDWRRMVLLSWVTMVLHSLKLGFFVMTYLFDRLGVRPTDLLRYLSDLHMPDGQFRLLREEVAVMNRKLDRILAGGGRGCVLDGYGNIYWDEEEASFLRIVEQIDLFYAEFLGTTCRFLDDRGVSYDRDELAEVFKYQRLRIPTRLPERAVTAATFSWNLPEYFETRFSSTPLPFEKCRQRMTATQTDYAGDHERFARETILWGRKSGTMLTTTTCGPADKAGPSVTTAVMASAG
jgi:putative methyltransferase